MIDIKDNINILKGVGEKTLAKFNDANIFLIKDLLLYSPKKYDILEEEIKLSEKKDFTPAILINLCQKCMSSSFDDIFNDMLKRRKKANKEKNNSR